MLQFFVATMILLKKATEEVEAARATSAGREWERSAAIGAGVAGVGIGAYTLSQMAKEKQQNLVTTPTTMQDLYSPATTQGAYPEFPFALQKAVFPMQYPNVTYPVRMPTVGDIGLLPLGESQTRPSSGIATPVGEEDRSFLVKVLEALQTASYLEGAGITGAKSLLAGEGFNYEWGTTPSEALGIKKKEESMFGS